MFLLKNATMTENKRQKQTQCIYCGKTLTASKMKRHLQCFCTGLGPDAKQRHLTVARNEREGKEKKFRACSCSGSTKFCQQLGMYISTDPSSKPLRFTVMQGRKKRVYYNVLLLLKDEPRYIRMEILQSDMAQCEQGSNLVRRLQKATANAVQTGARLPLSIIGVGLYNDQVLLLEVRVPSLTQ